MLVTRIRGRIVAAAALTMFAAVGLIATTADQARPINWGLDRIDQRTGGAANLDKHYRYAGDGTGVHIYVIDSGVRTTHQEFGGRAVFEANFCPDAVTPTGDDDGHGTHNASIAAGRLAGVAKNARVHAIRAFGPGCDEKHSPVERASYMIAALDWVLQHGQHPGVVNFSSGSLLNRRVQQKIVDAARAGFPVALSAACRADAAAQWGVAAERQAEGVFLVGSINRDDVAPPLDYGPALTLFAPAVHLSAALASSDSAYGEYGDFAECADSFAAPHVAGVVATYLQQSPAAAAAQVYADLIKGRPDHSPAWVPGVKNRHSAPDRILQSLSR